MIKISAKTINILVLNNYSFKYQDNYEKVTVMDKKTDDYLYIEPHRSENYENFGLVKLKIYCDDHNIKLISFGHKNQLPLLSMISDEIRLVDYPEYYDGIYGGTYGLTSWQNPQQESLNRVIMKSNLVTHINNSNKDSRIKKINDVDEARIKNFLMNQKIYIRKESFDIFEKEKISLPKDVIVCEIKKCKYRDKLLNESNFLGLDYTFQKSLVSRFKYHYMTLQILASFYLDWFYVCIGGSANLFSLLPIRCLMMGDSCLENSYPMLEKIYNGIPKLVYKYKNNESVEEIASLRDLARRVNYKLRVTQF